MIEVKRVTGHELTILGAMYGIGHELTILGAMYGIGREEGTDGALPRLNPIGRILSDDELRQKIQDAIMHIDHERVEWPASAEIPRMTEAEFRAEYMCEFPVFAGIDLAKPGSDQTAIHCTCGRSWLIESEKDHRRCPRCRK
jgi:hypothetical protein